ncbi:TetR/AcrR family transcriptional regulator [Methylophaga sp.]|uniref:TetR/AcrR family transcriptional regulator n=1 Tax=Methylophaga sp. TaxID=2024840 RepID=UPI003F6989DB
MAKIAPKDKRQTILDATLTLLASSGFHGFSMKQLAAESGVAVGTIYLYFADRDALIADLHRLIVDDFAARVFKDLNDNLPIKQQFLTLSRNTWDFCMENRNATLSKGQFDHLPLDVLKTRHNDAWKNSLNPLITFYDKGRQANVLKPLPDDVLASLIFEPVIHIATQTQLGLLDINESELNQIIAATWDAVAVSGQE